MHDSILPGCSSHFFGKESQVQMSENNYKMQQLYIIMQQVYRIMWLNTDTTWDKFKTEFQWTCHAKFKEKNGQFQPKMSNTTTPIFQ